MGTQKNDSIMTPKNIILISIAIAFAMTLFSFGFGREEQSYAFISCAILWGLGLIALAIYAKKSDS